MRKLLTSSLVIIAGVVSAPIQASLKQIKTAPAPDYRHDPRFASLDRFFQKGDCPARAYSHVFLEAADVYDLDWRLLPSISFVESTGGKTARNNNFFGWDGGKAEFSSPIAGIRKVAARLAHSDLYRNKGTDGILATYNPNEGYAAKVKWVMHRIAALE